MVYTSGVLRGDQCELGRLGSTLSRSGCSEAKELKRYVRCWPARGIEPERSQEAPAQPTPAARAGAQISTYSRASGRDLCVSTISAATPCSDSGMAAGR